MRRIFRLMGCHPVGYYDLSTAGLPVHATAFRPTSQASLDRNPFRIFTSLLRPELIADPDTRELAIKTLEKRSIFTEKCLALLNQADQQDGNLSSEDADLLVREALETFRWHSKSSVSLGDYSKLSAAHKLAADVCCFRSCHINHLTPRTLDIDAVQRGMAARGIPPKAVIEGPPPSHPILLRQTSFLALSEPIQFFDANTGAYSDGFHQARFGEIEQRSLALTKEGRDLYQQLLAEAQSRLPDFLIGSPSHSNTTDLNLLNEQHLESVFSPAFPSSLEEIRQQDLGYFRYCASSAFTEGKLAALDTNEMHRLDDLIHDGYITYEPLIYEDFLPASAAGIFQSNLSSGDAVKAPTITRSGPDQKAFEDALGQKVIDEFSLYEASQRESLDLAAAALGLAPDALQL